MKAKQHSEKTYFDYSRWLSFNGYRFKISIELWVKENDEDKNRTYTDKELFRMFIDESKNC